MSTSSSASGAADSASGSVAGTASDAPGSAMTRSILVTMNSRSLPTFLTFQPFAVISVDLGYDDLGLIASDFHHDDGSDCNVARVAHTYLLMVV